MTWASAEVGTPIEKSKAARTGSFRDNCHEAGFLMTYSEIGRRRRLAMAHFAPCQNYRCTIVHGIVPDVPMPIPGFPLEANHHQVATPPL